VVSLSWKNATKKKLKMEVRAAAAIRNAAGLYISILSYFLKVDLK
jgi:hypothetical protein